MIIREICKWILVVGVGYFFGLVLERVYLCGRRKELVF